MRRSGVKVKYILIAGEYCLNSLNIDTFASINKI